jgi:hypothetical protein
MIINVSKEEIKTLEKLNIISQMVPIKDKIKYFEQEYGCDFFAFEIEIQKKESIRETKRNHFKTSEKLVK